MGSAVEPDYASSLDEELIKKIVRKPPTYTKNLNAEAELFKRLIDKINIDVKNRLFEFKDYQDDLTQKAAITLLENFRDGKYKPMAGKSLAGYIYATVRIGVLEFIRKRKSSEPLPGDILTDENPDLQIIWQEHEEADRTRRSILARCLRGLNTKYRRTIYARYFLGLRFKEIGTKNNTSTQQAQDLNRQGLKLLKNCMKRKK